MSNYIPKEKSQNIYEAIKLEDQKARKDYKRMRIKELKYNKYQIKEVSNSHPCSCKTNGTALPTSRVLSAPSAAPADLSPDMSPLHLHQTLETDIKEIKRYLKTIMCKQKYKESLDKIKAEWRAIALVLDRLFFVLYVLSIIVSLATIFPRSAWSRRIVFSLLK